ncbi:hypothetical protein M9Y10_045637 [Tritrichomonas musculus]|uniref:Uncharacterized protein n=1 Tax=Tritrichomonas musculus TaxID=1915356 RepID=A0ABR2JVS7_9EUKA
MYSIRQEEFADLAEQNINATSEISDFNLSRDIQVLKLQKNNITTIGDTITKFRSLKFLNISSNKISKIQNVSTFSNLVLLDLSRNKITKLENLENNVKLKRLLVSRNLIQGINLKTPLKSLVLLDIHKNPIKQVNFGKVFPNLIQLYIDECLLKSLKGINTFANLKHFKCRKNAIDDSSSVVLSHPSIEDIDISDNKMKTLVPFLNLTTLTILNIKGNPLTDESFQIPKSLQDQKFLAKIPHLKTLIISNTEIRSVSLIFELFPNIENVDISYSQVSNLDDVTQFVKLAKHLKYLDLLGNPLTKDLYPDDFIKKKDGYDSISKFDLQYPKNAEKRIIYRQEILQCTDGNLETLDRIKTAEEYKISPKCSSLASSSQEFDETINNNSNNNNTSKHDRPNKVKNKTANDDDYEYVYDEEEENKKFFPSHDESADDELEDSQEELDDISSTIKEKATFNEKQIQTSDDLIDQLFKDKYKSELDKNSKVTDNENDKQLKEELKKKDASIQKLENDNQKLNSKIDELKKVRNHLSEQLKIANDNVNEFNQNGQLKDDAISERDKQINELKEKVTSLNDTIKSFDEKYSEINDSLEKEQKDNQNLKSEISKEKEESKKIHNLLSDYKMKISTLQSVIETKDANIEEMNQVQQKQLESIRKMSNENQKIINDFKLKSNEYENKLKEENENIEKLNNQLKDKESLIEDLKKNTNDSELQEINDKLQKQISLNEEKENQIQLLNSTEIKLNHEIEKLKESLTSKDDEHQKDLNKLKKNIEIRENEANELQSQIDGKIQEIQKLNKNLADQNDQILDLKYSLSQKDKEIGQLKVINDTIGSQSDSKFSDLNNQLSSLLKEKEETSEKLRSLEKSIQILKDENNNLLQTVDKDKEEQEKLKDQIKLLDQDKSELNKQIEELKSKINLLNANESEKEKEMSEKIEQYENQIKSNQDEHKSKENDILSLQSQLNELQEKLKKANDENQELSNKVSQKEIENQELSNKVSQKEIENQELSNKVSQKETELNEISSSIAQRESETNEKDQAKSLNQKEETIQELTNQYEQKEKENQELSKNLNQKEEAIEELTNNMSQKEEKIQELSSNLNQKEKENQEISKSLTQKDEKIQELSSNLNQKEKENQELTKNLTEKDGKIQELTNNLNQKEKENQELASTLNSKSEELKTIQASCDGKVSEYEQKMNELKSQNDKLKEEIEKISSMHNNGKQENQESSKNDEIIQQLKKEMEEKSSTLNQAQKENDELRRKFSENESRFKSILNSNTEKITKKKEEMTKNIDTSIFLTIANKLKENEKAIQKIASKVSSLLYKIKKLNNDVNDKEKVIHSLSSEKEKILESTNNKIDELSRSLSQKNKENESLSIKIKSLQKNESLSPSKSGDDNSNEYLKRIHRLNCLVNHLRSQIPDNTENQSKQVDHLKSKNSDNTENQRKQADLLRSQIFGNEESQQIQNHSNLLQVKSQLSKMRINLNDLKENFEIENMMKVFKMTKKRLLHEIKQRGSNVQAKEKKKDKKEHSKKKKTVDTLVQTKITSSKFDISEKLYLYDKKSLHLLVHNKTKDIYRHLKSSENNNNNANEIIPSSMIEKFLLSFERHNQAIVDQLAFLRETIRTTGTFAYTNQSPNINTNNNQSIDKLIRLVGEVLQDNKKIQSEIFSMNSNNKLNDNDSNRKSSRLIQKSNTKINDQTLSINDLNSDSEVDFLNVTDEAKSSHSSKKQISSHTIESKNKQSKENSHSSKHSKSQSPRKIAKTNNKKESEKTSSIIISDKKRSSFNEHGNIIYHENPKNNKKFEIIKANVNTENSRNYNTEVSDFLYDDGRSFKNNEISEIKKKKKNKTPKHSNLYVDDLINDSIQKVQYPSHLNPHISVNSPDSKFKTPNGSYSMLNHDFLNIEDCESVILNEASVKKNDLELNENSTEYKSVRFWLCVSLRKDIIMRSIIKINTSDEFSRFKSKYKAVHPIIVLLPVEKKSNLDLNSYSKINIQNNAIVFRYLSIIPKSFPQQFFLCATDLGIQSVQSPQKTDIPSQHELQKIQNAGYDSFIFNHNGIENIMIFSPSRIVPLYYISV